MKSQPLEGLGASHNNDFAYLAFGLVILAMCVPVLFFVWKHLFPIDFRRRPP